MDWSKISRETIAEVAKTVPETATLRERKAAIFAAYPFGERAYWPYKAWCKAQREYLARWNASKAPPTPLFPDMPRDPVSGRPVIA